MNLTKEVKLITKKLDGVIIEINIIIQMAIEQFIKRQKGHELFDGPHSTIFTRVCMCCNSVLGTKNAKGAPGGKSHGICVDCQKLY